MALGTVTLEPAPLVLSWIITTLSTWNGLRLSVPYLGKGQEGSLCCLSLLHSLQLTSIMQHLRQMDPSLVLCVAMSWTTIFLRKDGGGQSLLLHPYFCYACQTVCGRVTWHSIMRHIHCSNLDSRLRRSFVGEFSFSGLGNGPSSL